MRNNLGRQIKCIKEQLERPRFHLPGRQRYVLDQFSDEELLIIGDFIASFDQSGGGAIHYNWIDYKKQWRKDNAMESRRSDHAL